jgi:3,4-dihydroxy 2-butanone 4-phosphate synthase/GTP cyclohydrolase II
MVSMGACHGHKQSALAGIDEALDTLRRGRFIIVVDDHDRENEGDLMMAADKATPEAINFMATHGRGLVCLAMTPERLDELEVPLMVSGNTSTFETAFCISIEARVGTTTGISAADRAATIRAAIDPATRPRDLARPGHVFPLRARAGGVLARAGHTESAVDLSRMAGLSPAGVICEVMNRDGSMARVPDLLRVAGRHRLPLVSIADLIEYRTRTESHVVRVASAALPTAFGEFTVHAFESLIDRREHVALTYGSTGDGRDVLTHVHAQCVASDVFRYAGCTCAAQFEAAMRRVAADGCGVLLYLSRTGAAIVNMIRACAAMDASIGRADVPGPQRCGPDRNDYGVAAQMIRQLGVRSVRLLADDPAAASLLETYGMPIVERVPLAVPYPTQARRFAVPTR